jgi:hypothetical protein
VPFNLHIPLPGPLSYNARLGGGGKGELSKAIYWILVAPIWYPIKWMVLGMVWLCVFTARLCRVAVLYWARRQMAPAPTQPARTGRHHR